METVNKVIDSATQAIWGENSSQPNQQQQHGSEPVSGVTGKGTTADPYDAGNRDEQPGAPATQTGGVDPSDKPASYATSGKENYQTSGSDYPASGDAGASSSSEKGKTTTSELDSTTTNQGDKPDGEADGDDESGYTPSKSSGSAKQNVSIEALKGPQGPPPEHYDNDGLVGEAKEGGKGASLGKEEVGKGEAEIRQDNPATSSKPGKEDVSGKGTKAAHLKEKLHLGH
ncbi:hypothetical protein PVAR5_4724 [Paecilomyces variotii No. 5]|uniref:Solid-state culture expressed protein (Aos23) n=1 Tax=Byssochlamys spectabilis (strain No. 5 / NBRC 109023) TaxID=1356009 RepID=V5I0N6_BYSSN|nr:hypothetical protein PVAR5_4724 [Paecilomyces variotii No. 5]